MNRRSIPLLTQTVIALTLGIAGNAFAAPARDGILDPAFGNGGVVDLRYASSAVSELLRFRDLLELPDGKILLVASARPLNSYVEFPAVVRLLSNGALDTTFGVMGVALLDASSGIVPNGGEANAVARLDDGRLVVVGSAIHPTNPFQILGCRVIFALSSEGVLDATFGPAPGPACHSFGGLLPPRYQGTHIGAVIASGGNRVLIVDRRDSGVDSDQSVVARFDANGRLDASYGDNGLTVANVGQYLSSAGSAVLLLDETGALTVAAARAMIPGNTGLVRVLPEGGVDTTFGDNGFAAVQIGLRPTSEAFLAAVDRDSNGNLYLAMKRGLGGNTTCDYCIARFLPNGALDLGFNALGQQPGDPGTVQLLSSEALDCGYSVALLGRVGGGLKIAGSACIPGELEKGVGFTVFSLREDGSFDPRFGDIETPGRLSLQRRGATFAGGQMGAAKSLRDGRVLLVGSWGTVIRLMDDLVLASSMED